jgi:hypothetical protein
VSLLIILGSDIFNPSRRWCINRYFENEIPTSDLTEANFVLEMGETIQNFAQKLALSGKKNIYAPKPIHMKKPVKIRVDPCPDFLITALPNESNLFLFSSFIFCYNPPHPVQFRRETCQKRRVMFVSSFPF